MKLAISDLWRRHGTLTRGAYIFWGVLLFAIKYNIDRVVAATVFDQQWTIFSYFEQDENWDAANRRLFYQSMVAIALPFIWSGVVLTLRRLRAAGLPLWTVVLFFVPWLNLLFFAVLSVLPSKPTDAAPAEPGTVKKVLDRIVPRSRFGSALMASLAAIAITLTGTALSTSFLRTYGSGLFLGLPFCLGLVSVLIYGYHEPRRIGECLIVCLYSISVAGAALLVFALEGFICIIMAAPLAAGLAFAGGAISHAILSATWWRREPGRVLCVAILALPAVMGLEYGASVPSPRLNVKTAIVVNAPPAVVWTNVVSFAELEPPTEWLFRAGISYPIRAEIRGTGVGAIRYCNFSTGPFVEPIETWDEPKLLKFSVTSNPAPMQEWTPYKHVEPPHLDGFLASEGGQFLLTSLPDGRTLLEGTTWYRHNMWPVTYWQLWSDYIIHTIHLRVLNHVKNLSERQTLVRKENHAIDLPMRTADRRH